MGQNPSSTRTRFGLQRSFRGFVRRSKLNKSSLSHTFNLPPSEDHLELMNINTATEEQLMTLPGVNRQLARAIVRHRQMIGRFKRVDDLALVSGLGAEKLEALRPEICTKKPLSRASSRTHSLDSIRINSECRMTSVNSASVFQLQCVPGLNQELAANIVEYRNKKGPFKSLDDLIKVRGMDIVRLSTVKPHLNLEQRKCSSVQQLPNGNANGTLLTSFNRSLSNGISASTPRNLHRKSSMGPTRTPVTLPNGFAAAPVNDILDLLSAYSHRPIVEEDFQYERSGVKCCRIASWNLSQLTVDKISNPGVREVVCRTILENKFSLIAVQDVIDEASLRIICDELNQPYLRRVQEWKTNSGSWDFCIVDGSNVGFIYESKSKSDVFIGEVLLEQISHPASEPLLQRLRRMQEESCDSVGCQAFIINSRPLIIINVQYRGDTTDLDLQPLLEIADLSTTTRLPVVMLGDFYSRDNVFALQKCFEPLISEDAQTKVDLSAIGQSSIMAAGKLENSPLNGHFGVIKSGLSHLAIPRGWSWGGPASPYCPIWAEYNIDQ